MGGLGAAPALDAVHYSGHWQSLRRAWRLSWRDRRLPRRLGGAARRRMSVKVKIAPPQQASKGGCRTGFFHWLVVSTVQSVPQGALSLEDQFFVVGPL